MFKMNLGNVIKDFGKCSRRFRRMFKKALGNVPEGSRDSSRRFQEFFKKIPGNLNFDLSCEFFLAFLSNLAVKLLQTHGKKQLLNRYFEERFFFTSTYN